MEYPFNCRFNWTFYYLLIFFPKTTISQNQTYLSTFLTRLVFKNVCYSMASIFTFSEVFFLLSMEVRRPLSQGTWRGMCFRSHVNKNQCGWKIISGNSLRLCWCFKDLFLQEFTTKTTQGTKVKFCGLSG